MSESLPKYEMGIYGNQVCLIENSERGDGHGRPLTTQQIIDGLTERDVYKDRCAELEAKAEKWRIDSEDLEALHMNLDKAGVPRADGIDAIYSEWGRVLRYVEAEKAELEAENAALRERFANDVKARLQGKRYVFEFSHQTRHPQGNFVQYMDVLDALEAPQQPSPGGE